MPVIGRGFPMQSTQPYTGWAKQSAPGTVHSNNAMAQFTAVGAYTYTIPVGAVYVDVVALGGGSGGGYGFVGNPGNWAWATVKVSQVGPTIAGSVGAGGGGGVYGFGVGGNTTATSTGWSGLVAAGAQNAGTASSTSPGGISYNGRSYIGGPLISLGFGQTGAVPGGGGGPSFFAYGGGAGGQGAIWFYAYVNPYILTLPENYSQITATTMMTRGGLI